MMTHMNDHLGVPRTGVRIVEYDPRWVADFEAEKEALEQILGTSMLDIESVF